VPPKREDGEEERAGYDLEGYLNLKLFDNGT
jgi:hypothetical protein